MKIRGAWALITGGGRGIGRATAEALAKEGCNLILAARSMDELKDVERALAQYDAKIDLIQADLGTPDGARDLLRQALDRHERIHILINNAGIIIPSEFGRASLDDWQRTMDLNCTAPFLLSQGVMERMTQTGVRGYIVNLSSTVAFGVAAEYAAYGASKLALRGLSEALQKQGAPHGIRCSTVYPGITATAMVEGCRENYTPEKYMQPEDIAYCILFLLKQSDRMYVKDVVPWAADFDEI